MDKETLIENIIILLNERNIKVSESVLRLYIDRTIQYILNYCNLTEFPHELDYTLIDMVVNQCDRVATESGSDGVNSISEGGRTVSFITSSTRLAEFQDFDNHIKSILNKFKVFYKYGD